MDEIRERAKHHFPSVLLTLLSIIQALSLEVIWSTATSTPHLVAGGLDAWIGWLQILATFLGIMLIWLLYISLVMRIVWVPTFRDSIIPFVIGLGEFVLAWGTAPAFRPIWMLVLAGIFGICSWASSTTFSRARQERENERFFRILDPSHNSSDRMAMILVATIVGFAIVLVVAGPSGYVALVMLILANALILLQMHLVRRFWHGAIAPDSKDRR
jgi:hypothetical protein